MLVVEDHQAYRALMGWFLQKFELAHELVGDGQAGLTAFSRKHFDLVISDCRMPVLDGYSMAREIRRREATHGRGRVPIIAVTAKLGAEDARRCLEAGMDAWVLKPLSLERLRDLLESWLPLPPDAASLPATVTPAASQPWPTRADLIQTFGDTQVVDQMLRSLVLEADADYARLLNAGRTLDKYAMIECLHRLAGSLAFLGGTELDGRAAQLIEQVRKNGVQGSRQALQQFEKDVVVYLRYLTYL
ncbi:response regulator [Pseudomonas sp. Bout1]|uniref:response regulator n=1 Tax=Pseudomonas sp. Bout1 TaxID=3048600 RepID=UPI002AB4A515|nr:response regulator [Pseudomonas sp. Bout1]MDY7535261.1 response regulator [Pseudomonas sp. Bout1]MEB0184865.1 response regulator [Pseudomonas sp. Bout1]